MESQLVIDRLDEIHAALVDLAKAQDETNRLLGQLFAATGVTVS